MVVENAFTAVYMALAETVNTLTEGLWCMNVVFH